VSSFGEKKALKFAREDPKTFLQHNQRHLSRIYPAGGRVDSSNYDPMILWTVGSQLGTDCLLLFSVYLLLVILYLFNLTMVIMFTWSIKRLHCLFLILTLVISGEI